MTVLCWLKRQAVFCWLDETVKGNGGEHGTATRTAVAFVAVDRLLFDSSHKCATRETDGTIFLAGRLFGGCPEEPEEIIHD
jgi:hypothetical protein